MKKFILAASVLTLLFTACKKEGDSPSNPQTPGHQLKKITETINGQVTVYNLNYDASKRLTSIKSADNHEMVEFTYDANGNVVKMEQREDNVFKNLYTFAYNNGVPATGTYKSWELTAGEPDALIEDDVLTYTVTNNQVSKIKVNMTLDQEIMDIDLTYENGNVSQVKSGGAFGYTATFAYGDKKSPYPQVFKYVMDHEGVSVAFFTKNDLKSVAFDVPGTEGDSTVTTTYTYDSAGYPLTSTSGTTTTKFEYQ